MGYDTGTVSKMGCLTPAGPRLHPTSHVFFDRLRFAPRIDDLATSEEVSLFYGCYYSEKTDETLYRMGARGQCLDFHKKVFHPALGFGLVAEITELRGDLITVYLSFWHQSAECSYVIPCLMSATESLSTECFYWGDATALRIGKELGFDDARSFTQRYAKTDHRLVYPAFRITSFRQIPPHSYFF